MIYCRECRRDLPAFEFFDSEGQASTRCRECREKEPTKPQTPHSRRASGLISTEAVKKLMEERDTLVPPPEPEKKS